MDASAAMRSMRAISGHPVRGRHRASVARRIRRPPPPAVPAPPQAKRRPHAKRLVRAAARCALDSARGAGALARWGAGAARTFLMIMTRNGSLMPRVFVGSAGHETKVVEMLVDMISITLLWMSLSVMRLM